MNSGLRVLAAVGRICLSLMFIVTGASTLFSWDLAESGLAEALMNWEMYASNSEKILTVTSALSEFTLIFLIVLVVLQILGGLLLFLGIQVRLGAFLLFLYVLTTMLLYNHFWFFAGQAMSTALVLFLKDLSIIGGLFIVLAFGKGNAPSSGRSKPSKSGHENVSEDS